MVIRLGSFDNFQFRRLCHVLSCAMIGTILSTNTFAAEDVVSQVRSLRVGGATVEVVISQVEKGKAKEKVPHWLLCNLHDNENTSVEAARTVLAEYPVRLVELKHTGKREIVFPISSAEYRCDPNRIFTPIGVKATLQKLSDWTVEADREVTRLGQQLIELYRLSEVQAVIALHNNTEERYSASSYAAGQEYAADASLVHLQPGADPDDFFFVTERRFFDALAKRGYNVVLQNNATVTDDGSLSVYCGKREVPYVNVEAQHGHLDRQVEMLKTLFEVLKQLENDNHERSLPTR